MCFLDDFRVALCLGILWIMACILGVIWEAFWGSRASVKLNFAWAKSQVAIFGVSRVSLFFRIYFQRAPREHFYGFGTRSGFHVGTIVNKFCTFLGYWLRDRKKLISRCTFGRGRRQGVTHRKTFSGPERNLRKVLSRPCNPEGVRRILRASPTAAGPFFGVTGGWLTGC